MRTLVYSFLVVCVIMTLLSSVADGSNGKAFVAETFEQDPFQTGSWKKSDVDKYADQPVAWMASTTAPERFMEDKGLRLSQEMKHYGFGVSFPTVSLRDLAGDLVVQYEVKFDETLNCGGAYIKLLRDGDMGTLDGSTAYSIMFGPDRCGATNKIHFILQHRNPISGLWEEKHFNESLPVKADTFTHLYSLRVGRDNTFAIALDNKVAAEGNLLTHMVPPVNPDKEVYDPQDLKPRDWVDDEFVVDKNAVKPDDWDEKQPRRVPDAHVVQPADWLVDEPLEVPDPKAVKPEDWSDEEDGEWEPPLVPNPRCETAAGCGKWTPPLVDNPLYKGKWVPPKIKNPSYKGIWKPRLIPNPNYFEDLQPALSAVSFSALAVEVWTTNAGVHFDNFLIAEGQASQVGQFIDLFKAKHLAEKEKFKQEHPEEAGNEGWQGLLNSLHSHVLDYVQLLATDKLALGVTIAAVLGSALLMSFLLSTAGDKVRKEKRDKKEMEARDESKSEEVSETTRELAGADKPDSQ